MLMFVHVDGWRWLMFACQCMTFEGQRPVGFVSCHLMPGLDACDVAKEPFVFYGAKLPRLPRTNLIHLSFTVTNKRTWCIDFNPLLFAWICPAPMSSLWQLGEVLVPSLVAFETSFIISRIEATSGSITETKTFTTLSPCLSDSAHGAHGTHGAHGARCMHPPIESFCVCWHMLARLSHFAATQFWFPKLRFVRPAKKRFNFSFFPTGSTDPMNRRQTWPNGSTGWRAKSAKWIVWRCLEFYHEAHYRYYSRIEVIEYFYVFFILGTSVKEITGDAHNPLHLCFAAFPSLHMAQETRWRDLSRRCFRCGHEECRFQAAFEQFWTKLEETTTECRLCRPFAHSVWNAWLSFNYVMHHRR